MAKRIQRSIFLIFCLPFWLSALSANQDRIDETAPQDEDNSELQLALEKNQKSIDDIQALNGNLSIQLLEPLQEKGRILSAQGRKEDAAGVLNHAIHLLRRHEGVYTLKQLNIIEELVEISIEKDKPLQADSQQHFAYYINSRFYGEDNPELLPATYDLVKWYMRSGQLKKSMQLLNKAIDTMDKQGLQNDPRLIEAHLMMAKARRLQGICCSENGLETALEIIKQNPKLPSDITSKIYLELADAFMINGKFKEATKYYALLDYRNSDPSPIVMSKVLDKARQSLTTIYKTNEDEIGPSLVRLTREEHLLADNQPPQQFFIRVSEHKKNFDITYSSHNTNTRKKVRELIGYPFQFYRDQVHYLLRFSNRGGEQTKQAKITIDFTVNIDGSLTNIEIIETNAPIKINRLIKKTLSKTTFRPALLAGKPIVSDHVRITQTFF